MVGTASLTAKWSNWAGNQRGSATAILRPGSPTEVAEAVRSVAADGGRIRVTGSGHSFTAVALADDRRMELSELDSTVSVDVAHRLVTVPAGMTLHALNGLLARHGLALPNLGDIDAQTVAGAISTGTHGTGAGYGCLSTFVEAITLVTGTGEVLRCSADENRTSSPPPGCHSARSASWSRSPCAAWTPSSCTPTNARPRWPTCSAT